MSKSPVYYAGTVGSFSERAAQQFLKSSLFGETSFELIPSIDPPSTLQAWNDAEDSAYAVVPVWSDVLGPIPTARAKMIELGWALPADDDSQWMASFKKLFIQKNVGEILDELALPIHFDLLIARGVVRGNITRIAAYSVALAQCKKGIERELGPRVFEIQFVEYPDSALAAKDLSMLAKDPNATVTVPGIIDPKNTSVLALPSSAEQFGLDCAWANVQDNPEGNHTHFILLKR